MMKIFIFIYFFYVTSGQSSTSDECVDCVGKIHTTEQLQLTRQALILNKNQTCLHERYKFIVIVKSASFQRRKFTRATWAKELIEHFDVPVLYAVGYPNESRLEADILLEDEEYKDLLQFNIIESYYNLTLKTTSVLVWFDQYCSKNTDYLLYVDDDILVHADKLIIYMNHLKKTDALLGWFEKSGKIHRKGRGGVSKTDFPFDYVPDYLWGAAVLYPSNTISNGIIRTIFNTTLPIYFRDDVFINGFIAKEAGIKRKYMPGVLLFDNTEDDIKTHAIIISFDREEDLSRAWDCYKSDINCNENLLLLLAKILCGLILIGSVLGIAFLLIQRTSIYDELKRHFCFMYYQLSYNSSRRTIHSAETRDRFGQIKDRIAQIFLIIPSLFRVKVIIGIIFAFSLVIPIFVLFFIR